MPNNELLERVMTYIEDHPEQHNQNVWINDCGTAACFAGWVWLLSGKTMEDSDSDISEFAGNELEITERDSVVLFHGLNTRENLKLMVKDLMNGESLHKNWTFYYDEGWQRESRNHAE